MYLIVLKGQGDTEIKVVGPLTWAWLTKPAPDFGGDSMVEERLPDDVIAEMRALDPVGIRTYEENMAADQCVPFVCETTIGSYDNDRALFLPAKSFDTARSAFGWMAARGMTVVDDYHGYIY